jgi:hypothetical protein
LIGAKKSRQDKGLVRPVLVRSEPHALMGQLLQAAGGMLGLSFICGEQAMELAL